MSTFVPAENTHLLRWSDATTVLLPCEAVIDRGGCIARQVVDAGAGPALALVDSALQLRIVQRVV